VSRVFLSHSSRDYRQAMAVKAWLIEHEPGLAEEVFLDVDPHRTTASWHRLGPLHVLLEAQ
jgi:hypothetical protein